MQRTFDYSDIRKQVLEFLKKLDIQPYDESDIVLDGELHRYRIHDDKPGQKSGAICIHMDGWAAGFVMDWRKDLRENWKYDISGLDIDDEQRAYYNSDEYKKKCEAEHQRKEKERQKYHLEFSERARRLWEKLPEAPKDHPYLQRKNVKAYGLKYDPDTGSLAVPIWRKNGLIFSIQWIPAAEGLYKLFYKGAEISGAFFSIGLEKLKEDPKQIILLGEGYATMAKVHELTGKPCVAAMSCHRLQEIAKILHEAYPEATIIITADNDHKTEARTDRNPGLLYARLVVQAKLAIGIAAPDFEENESGSDWDDFALIHGDKYTASVLADKILNAENSARIEYYQALAQELGVLRVETFADFIKPPKNPDWMIDLWIPSEGFVMLFAPSGSGKSFAALDLALAIASEEIDDWHGQKILRHGEVIYFTGEGKRGMKKRCAALCAAKGIDPKKVKMHIVSDSLAIDDKDPKAGIERIKANIGSICINPVLVIFDTMSRYMAGDENKSVDAAQFVACCEKIQREFGCVVQVVHHTGLSKEAQDRVRGSSVYKGSTDIELKITKDKDIITIEMTKSKDTDTPPAKKLQMKKVTVDGYFKSSGELDDTCVLEDVDESESAESAESIVPAKKLSDSEELAKRSYSEAAKQYGRMVQDEERGKEVVVVSKKHWQDVFFSLSNAGNPDTKRRLFRRVKNSMKDKLMLVFRKDIDEEECYALYPADDAYELGIVLHLRRKENETGQDRTKEN